MNEMQWQIDERTIRDCPGNRTEQEWRQAVLELEDKLKGIERHCSKCGQSLNTASFKYVVTETESWLPSCAELPRGRWGLTAHARTIHHAKRLREFMGERATIWVRRDRQPKGGGTAYKLWRKQ